MISTEIGETFDPQLAAIWSLNDTQKRLISRQSSRTFTSLPEISNKFGWYGNAIVLALFGAIITIPRMMRTKALISIRKQMTPEQMQRVMGMSPNGNAEMEQFFKQASEAYEQQLRNGA